MVDDAQCVAERGRGLGLVAGHERAQDAVVDFVVEDREAQAVGREGIEVAVRDAGDDAVAGQAGSSSANTRQVRLRAIRRFVADLAAASAPA